MQENSSNEKSSKILISFCNIFPKGFGLGIFDFENESFQWVDLGREKSDIRGVTGIIFHEDHYWTLVQNKDGPSGSSALYKFNKNFELVNTYSLKLTKDAHSIISFEDGFLVNDSGNDRVNKIVIKKDNTLHETEFWAYNDKKIDSYHVNSITKKNNIIFVSMFGKKPEEGWPQAKSGSIINIQDNSFIKENLFHPHSLVCLDEKIFLLESKRGFVYQFNSNKNIFQVILKLPGYLRGITSDEKYLYIGASAARRKSKSTGSNNITDTSNPDDFHSWLYKINKTSLEYQRKDLTVYGAEIYDLHKLSHSFSIFTKDNPILRRIWGFEDVDREKEKKDLKNVSFMEIRSEARKRIIHILKNLGKKF